MCENTLICAHLLFDSIVESSTGWKLGFCNGAGVVAVLQESVLEVRHSKLHYKQVIAKTDASKQ